MLNDYSNKMEKTLEQLKITSIKSFMIEEKNDEHDSKTVDFVLVTPELVIKQHGVLSDVSSDGRKPSTHRPVVADIILI